MQDNDNDTIRKEVMEGKRVPIDMLLDIAMFHQKFEIPRLNEPGLLKVEDMGFRIGFLFEEMQELVDAYEGDDLVQQFDALIDLIYVALGTAYMMGLPFADGWSRVHSANMKKERATDEFDLRSKRGNALDVVKPEGWVAPDLTDLCSPIILKP